MFEAPQVPAENVVALDDIKDHVKTWRTAVERARYWKESASEAALEIITRMRQADASTGTLAEVPIVVLTSHTHQHIDAVSLRADHPELAEGYTEPHNLWRLHLASWMDSAA